MSVVLFSGGRGNRNLLRYCASSDENAFPQLDIVVNGLDDGASTGMIREIFQNATHGISDFLKVTLAVSPRSDLVELCEERFAISENYRDEMILIKSLYEFMQLESSLDFLEGCHGKPELQELASVSLSTFLNYCYKAGDGLPSLGDFKVGNIIFASLLIDTEFDFTRALKRFCELCEVDHSRFRVMESTNAVSYLVGTLKNGALLPNEAAVVLTRTSDFIDEIFQLRRPLTAAEIRAVCSLEHSKKNDYLESIQFNPHASDEVLNSIKNAEAIIFGAGTPYSSLFPSLELDGIEEAIAESNAPKILVSNLEKETANMMSGVDLVSSTLRHLSKHVKGGFDPRNYITHLVVPELMAKSDVTNNSIETTDSQIEAAYNWIRVVRADVRSASDSSKHDGEALARTILGILSVG